MSASDDLKHIMQRSILMTDLQHAHVQLRFVAALLAGSMMFTLLDPAVLLLADPAGVYHRAAHATSFGPYGLAAFFLFAAAMLIPFMAVQLGAWKSGQRFVTKATCWVLTAASLVWFFLLWRSLQLDLGSVAQLVFARSGMGAMGFALALGISLNAELLRTALEPHA